MPNLSISIHTKLLITAKISLIVQAKKKKKNHESWCYKDIMHRVIKVSDIAITSMPCQRKINDKKITTRSYVRHTMSFTPHKRTVTHESVIAT